MKNKLLSVLLTGLSVLTLFGCSSNGGSVSSDSSNKKSDGEKNEEIVVYTNSVDETRKDFFMNLTKEAGFNVKLVQLGGNELFNRLIAEKNAPVADVVFGMNQMLFKQVADEDMLVSYKPEWIDKVDSTLVNEDALYSPIQEQRVFMIYDKNKIAKKDAVSDWQELANNEKYKEKYVVPKELGGATVNAVIYNILLNYVDENGEMGISSEGWKELEKFIKNGTTASEGQTEITELTNGNVDYSFTWLSNVAVVEETMDIELGIVNPDYGVFQTVEQIGILKKDNIKEKKVQKFVDFLGSAEAQSKWAKEFGSVPVNKDAEDAINPKVKEVLEQTTPQKVDYDFLNKHLSEWAEYIELNIIGN